MKKQLMRYRLIADQKVGRANKSEVLNEELLQVEKHMDHVRIACQSTYKKLSQGMQSHGAGDYDKRMKRLTETTLAQTMLDASKALLSEADSNQMLGNSLNVCGKAQMEIAKEKTMYEMFVDEHIISPLQSLVESEIPSVLKQREKLKRLVLDRDGALQNYNKAHKAQFTPGINLQQTMNKADSLKDEYDQAVIRMEQCKDQLVTEMFEYLSKEAGHGQRMADFYAKQLDYHRRCAALLEKLEPEMNAAQEKAITISSYGRQLSEHLRVTDREIASPIEACVLCLLEFGLKEEGLFRIGGGATKLRKFKALVDGGILDLSAYDAQDDIHAVAGALKQYLRDLPHPLLTHELHDEWMAATSISDNDQRLQEIWTIVDKLPRDNKANFRYLIKFCAIVAEHQNVNKMSASNLAVVLAPNLLWSNMDDISKRMMQSNLITNIIESIITYSDWFFPEEIDFVATPNATSYNLNYNDVASTDPHAHSSSQPMAAPLSPTIPSKQAKSPSHSRSSSSDLNLSTDNLSGKQKKQKSKAPRPPQNPPQKSHERTKSSPPLVSHPTYGNGNNLNKPPVAAKRMSMKKPQMPPPHPPKEELVDSEQAPSNGKMPKARPRPPIRKQNPTSNPTSSTDQPTAPSITISEPILQPQEKADEPQSPPMPDLPPPPLPEDLDLGADLTSELQLNRNEMYQVSSEEEDVQLTPL